MNNTRVVMLLTSFAGLAVGCQPPTPIELSTESVRVHAVVAQGSRKPPGVPDDFVATPVGYFHPSCLIHVDSGESVGDDGTIRTLAGTTRRAAACAHPHYDSAGHIMTGSRAAGAAELPSGDATAPSQDAPAPALAPEAVTNDIEGWSLADHSSYSPGVSYLTARWVVPPTPPQAGQVLFFFPGTQSLDGKPGGTILQPVLAYENAKWFVQSWNCCEGGGNAEYGDAVDVRPGDVIVGTNIGSNCDTQTGICNNWRIITADQTTGRASTFDTLSFGHPHQWIFAAVLEVYSLKSCDQLPTTGSLTFHEFGINDLFGRAISVPSLRWQDDVDASLAGCGSTWGGSQSGTDFTVTFGGPRGGGSTYRIVAPFSGKCLDINGAGTADGTKVQEWTCNGTGAQVFHLAASPSGGYQIINDHSGKCIDIAYSGTTDGTKAQLWTCNGTGAQSFNPVDVGGGNIKLVNTNSGKCVDINGANAGDGTQVQLWTCNGTVAQTWQLQAL